MAFYRGNREKWNSVVGHFQFNLNVLDQLTQSGTKDDAYLRGFGM
jgi:hypothetical protein